MATLVETVRSRCHEYTPKNRVSGLVRCRSVPSTRCWPRRSSSSPYSSKVYLFSSTSFLLPPSIISITSSTFYRFNLPATKQQMLMQIYTLDKEYYTLHIICKFPINTQRSISNLIITWHFISIVRSFFIFITLYSASYYHILDIYIT